MIHPVYFSYTKNVRLCWDPALQLVVNQHQKPLAGFVCACVCVSDFDEGQVCRFASDLILSLKNVLFVHFFHYYMCMCGICHTVRVHSFRMALWYNDTIQTCARSCTYPKSQ